MTQIVAVGTSDRIIALADGRAMISGTDNRAADALKIFRLTSASAVLVSGNVPGYLPQLFEELPNHLAQDGVDTYSDVVEYMEDFASKNNWNFKDSQSIVFIVAGYKGDGPLLTLIEPGRESVSSPFVQASGSLSMDEQITFCKQELPEVPVSKFEYRDAERFAVRLLAFAEVCLPVKVGGQEQMWHLFPDRIEIKSSSYTERLRKKYTKDI